MGHPPSPLHYSQGSGGDYVYVCIKRGGHVRDVRLVTPATAPVGDGWSIVKVDLSMVVDGDRDEGAQWLAYGSGGNKPPVTDIACVVADSAAAAAAQHPDWELLGLLPGSRAIMIRRGEGMPLTSIAAFRSPVATPRYGYEQMLDFSMGYTGSGTVVPSGPDDPTLCDPRFPAPLRIFHRYRCASGDPMTFESAKRVTGFRVSIIYGHDLAASGFDADGKRRVNAGELAVGGTVYGIMYRDTTRKEDATEDVWTIDGSWRVVGSKVKQRGPVRLSVTVPRATADNDTLRTMHGACGYTGEDEQEWEGFYTKEARFSDTLLARQGVTRIIVVPGARSVELLCVCVRVIVLWHPGTAPANLSKSHHHHQRATKYPRASSALVAHQAASRLG